MIQLAMSPEQFAKARTAILTSPDVLQHAEHSPMDGTFSTSQVTIDYSYAPSYPAGQMALDVTAKHGLARFASENTIKEYIQELLAKV